MPATVIVGLQWGDEGKGKATDFLAEQVRWVVRYQGGDNAGHTIVLGREVFKLHLVPSGVLYPHIVPLIGPGVVVNPATLIRELDALAARGVDASRVRVSHAAHVILPYHVAQDRASEARLGREGIGTTSRGIGPAYADRAARVGVRMEDLLDPAALRHKLERVVPDANARLAHLGDHGEPFLVEAILEEALGWGARLRPAIADTTTLVQDALRAGDHVLLEGAQGTLLDIDHGSYPFVTSSSPVAGGACTGGGIGPLQVSEVIGVMKAYTTRVGAGPYPTELHDAIGEGIAMRGHEFGTTTGRRRRVGWFDAVPLRYAVDVNSVSSIVLNKLESWPASTRSSSRRLRDRRPARGTLARPAEEVGRATPVYSDSPAGRSNPEAPVPNDHPPDAALRPGRSWSWPAADRPSRSGRSGPDVVMHERPLASGRPA